VKKDVHDPLVLSYCKESDKWVAVITGVYQGEEYTFSAKEQDKGTAIQLVYASFDSFWSRNGKKVRLVPGKR